MESKNKKWLWVAIFQISKPEDTESLYLYRTHTFYGTRQQVQQDFLPLIEQTLMACGWNIFSTVIQQEDSHNQALTFTNGVTGKIIKD